jgi:hypothetical protein
MNRRHVTLIPLLSLGLLLAPASRAQTTAERDAAARIVGEDFTNGRQLKYVSALSDDIGAGRPQGWFSMRRTDLDADIRELSQPLSQFGDFAIEHAAFAATDNAPFMAEGVPNLILIQDETPYFPVHTIADTPDKIEPRDYASAVAVFAATAYEIADRPQRFGRRFTADEIRRMADETKVGEQ